MSKITARLIYKQIDKSVNDELSSLLTVFPKNHNTQHRHLSMIENWRKKFAKGKYVGALSMDLSKAFDANDLYEHNLLIVKLEAYCF